MNVVSDYMDQTLARKLGYHPLHHDWLAKTRKKLTEAAEHNSCSSNDSALPSGKQQLMMTSDYHSPLQPTVQARGLSKATAFPMLHKRSRTDSREPVPKVGTESPGVPKVEFNVHVLDLSSSVWKARAHQKVAGTHNKIQERARVKEPAMLAPIRQQSRHEVNGPSRNVLLRVATSPCDKNCSFWNPSRTTLLDLHPEPPYGDLSQDLAKNSRKWKRIQQKTPSTAQVLDRNAQRPNIFGKNVHVIGRFLRHTHIALRLKSHRKAATKGKCTDITQPIHKSTRSASFQVKLDLSDLFMEIKQLINPNLARSRLPELPNNSQAVTAENMKISPEIDISPQGFERSQYPLKSILKSRPPALDGNFISPNQQLTSSQQAHRHKRVHFQMK